jgi:proton-dependent oligopeptide transporter, POT family
MLKKHPKGLAVLFFTEMWERVGFYTLMAILVLYMDKEFAWPDARKADIYGIFLGLCYFIPLLGGWLGDRVLGRLRTIRIGAVLMACGYAALALSSQQRLWPFFAGLLLIAFGTGIFKVNMSVTLGQLYAGKPELKDTGFNIYYMGVNVGAMIAPLLATLNSVVFHSYTLSFWISAAGLLLALLILGAGEKHLPQAKQRPLADRIPGEQAAAKRSAADAREEARRIVTLLGLFAIVIFFWVSFYQNGFALTLFAERSTRKLEWLRPETYQFFEPFFILALTPLMLALFARLRGRGREPFTPQKILLGMGTMAMANLVMVWACLGGGNRDANIMSPGWLIGTYLVVTLAEILISPMGQSFVTKVAPARFQGLLMGGWFAATAVGSYGSGLVGKWYGAMPHHRYFLLLTALIALAVLLLLAIYRALRRYAD